MKHAFAVLAAIAAFSIMPAEAASLGDSVMSADIVSQNAMAGSDASTTDGIVGAIAYILLLMVLAGAL